jgi:hypothetical protein
MRPKCWLRAFSKVEICCFEFRTIRPGDSHVYEGRSCPPLRNMLEKDHSMYCIVHSRHLISGKHCITDWHTSKTSGAMESDPPGDNPPSRLTGVLPEHPSDRLLKQNLSSEDGMKRRSYCMHCMPQIAFVAYLDDCAAVSDAALCLVSKTKFAGYVRSFFLHKKTRNSDRFWTSFGAHYTSISNAFAGAFSYIPSCSNGGS